MTVTRGHKPTRRGPPPAPGTQPDDDAATEIYDSGNFKRENATPVKAISMKTPADPKQKPVEKPEREMPHIKLRALSEMTKSQHSQNLGNLAPPYDPAEARARTFRDIALWGSLAVIIASGIALVVWLVAG